MFRYRSGWLSGGLLSRAVASLVAVAAWLVAGPAVAAAGPSPEGVEFFEKNIRPLLVDACYSCHSASAKQQKGGLSLDSPEAWLRGGDLGAAVTPGAPDDSLLIVAVRQDEEFLKMPPKGKLSDQQIALLTRWVEMGAPAPAKEKGAPRPGLAASQGAGAGRDHWAFQPLASPTPPEVTDVAWPRNELDRFILATLEAKELKPAPPADRRTLIRRATFDLTGLPPTPEEINTFLDDQEPGAYARLIDRLLGSPAYGERWGRHWLDVARYADSNGLDENVAHGNAWRYRDYVVAAFNNDKPYDQFVLEQLAGDLLPPADSTRETHERLIATGFLSLGPKVLAEPDKQKLEMDIVDEQVDTVGRALMALTLGCARCHDHKFDPILTADYYGLAGVFKSTRTMETLKTVARWHENSLASAEEQARKDAHDAQVAAKKKTIEERSKRADKAADPEQAKAELKRLRAELADLEKAAPELPSAMGVTEGTVGDVPIHIRGSHLTLGEVVPRRVPVVLAKAESPGFSASQSGRLELARWLTSEDHPLTARVMVNRIWRWHFGRGLVGTPDNFGLLGESPSHPALLDWLARHFQQSGWSIKAMHRLIMLSSTYRMSSDFNPVAAKVDPENRLHWRMDIRRLEAEVIRDALLAVSGTLDRSVGGSLLTVKNHDYFFNHTSKDATGYDTHRRSIYLPVVRNHLYDLFQLFDSTDASVTSGDRATTTVATQALLMMNSDLVLQAARDLASGLLDRDNLDDAGRLRLLYARAYGREPTPDESSRAAAFLDEFKQAMEDGTAGNDAGDARLGAWQALCQVVLAANEFVHIR